MNIRDLTDDELAEILDTARNEYYRRSSLTQALSAAPEFQTAFLEQLERESGAEYVKPLGAHDAYPKGWEVTYDGKTWVALRDGAHETPGVSADWQRVGGPDEILPWVQPRAGTEYWPGALVTHDGHVWRNDYDGPNGWEPGVPQSQWADLGLIEDYEEGEDQEEGEDPEENEILEWAQPIAGAEYPLGVIVSYEGHVWRNEHEANGWTPGTTGSQWTDLGLIEDYESEEE